MMKDWLTVASEYAIVVIDFMALVVVAQAALEAFIRAMRSLFSPVSGRERRDIWLRFARGLVAGLTFQLAADVIETSISTDWATVGRIAAVAVIRTFLNYFLERDLAETRERQHEPEGARPEVREGG